MAKVTFVQHDDDAQMLQYAENYTQVNGIYGNQITPQFLSGVDNVQVYLPECVKLEHIATQSQDIRFFRIR